MSTKATYIGPTQFSITGSRAAEYSTGLRVLADCGADGLRLGSATSAIYSAGRTVVTLDVDGGAVLTTSLASVRHAAVGLDSLPRHAAMHSADGDDPLDAAGMGVASADELANEVTARQTHEAADNPHIGSASTSALASLAEAMADIDADLAAEAAALVAHKAATPAHTAAQVGLGSVTNDAQVKRAEMGMPGGTPTLDVDALVVQDPASASTTPGPGAIPKAGLSGLLDAWISPASTAVAGKVQLATTTEAQAGTDTSRAVTPAALAAVAQAEGWGQFDDFFESNDNGDLMPSTNPISSRNFTLNANGDIQPDAA